MYKSILGIHWVFGDKFLRGIFGPVGEEVTRRWRKFYEESENVELFHQLYFNGRVYDFNI
jgi:hypothetical protein